MDSNKIIIHVGPYKTATTFLQKIIFPNLKNIHYIFGSKAEENSVWHKLSLINDSEGVFKTNQDIEFYCKEVKNYLRNIVPNERVLFSTQTLVGSYPLALGNNKENTEVLKKLFPRAKIFLIIRKQADWLESAYAEGFKYVDLPPLNECTGYKFNKFSKNTKNLNIYRVNWLEIYKKYCIEYGEENVCILPYELFKKSPAEFLEKFYKFFDLEPFYPSDFGYVHKTKNELSKTAPVFLDKYIMFICDNFKAFELYKFIFKNDKFIRKILSKFKRTIKLNEQKFNEHQKKLIFDAHKANNEILAQKIGINLSKYGYY